ncbi:hypothetical protein GIB67_039000 [Kingdonia uniflora]|uniref:Uncharacterized protein n=1 Tax=Kingdonia uniflora TaxID=39325 RepID=A0A7J7P6L5_9MAGN|nr:hypothetical protein GIB67_039000 [Kingdonia uniflora]
MNIKPTEENGSQGSKHNGRQTGQHTRRITTCLRGWKTTQPHMQAVTKYPVTTSNNHQSLQD